MCTTRDLGESSEFRLRAHKRVVKLTKKLVTSFSHTFMSFWNLGGELDVVIFHTHFLKTYTVSREYVFWDVFGNPNTL